MTPVERLTALWKRAAAKTRQEGREWYPAAYLRYMDAGGGLDPDALPGSRAAAIGAILSPRVPFKRSVALVALARSTGRVSGTMGALCAKAQRVLDGANPLEVITGPKTLEYYRALIGNTDAAVCDVHMFRAMGLDRAKVKYSVAADHVRAAASLAAEPVAQYQATCWIVQRGAAW